MIEVNFVMKGDWLIFVLKEGEECIPIVESGWEKDLASGTFVCFRVVTGYAENSGRVARRLETLLGLHHASRGREYERVWSHEDQGSKGRCRAIDL